MSSTEAHPGHPAPTAYVSQHIAAGLDRPPITEVLAIRIHREGDLYRGEAQVHPSIGQSPYPVPGGERGGVGLRLRLRVWEPVTPRPSPPRGSTRTTTPGTEAPRPIQGRAKQPRGEASTDPPAPRCPTDVLSATVPTQGGRAAADVVPRNPLARTHALRPTQSNRALIAAGTRSIPQHEATLGTYPRLDREPGEGDQSGTLAGSLARGGTSRRPPGGARRGLSRPGPHGVPWSWRPPGSYDGAV